MIDNLQLQMRRDKLGGSDAAACCGIDPYRTPYDLWAQKTGRIPPFKGNQATEAGSYFEPSLINYLADRLQATISRDQLYMASDGIRIANLDGVILTGSEPATVEAKTCGLLGPSHAVDTWGEEEEGIEGIPPHVLIQVHHGFGVLDETIRGVRLNHTIAFIRDRGFCHYRIPRSDDLVEAVAYKVAKFKRDYIDTDTAPPGQPSLEVAKLLRRVPSKTVDVADAVIIEWCSAREQRLAAEKKEGTALAKLLGALGDAEAAQCSAGLLTYYETNRAAYSVSATTYRTPRFKANKPAAGGERNRHEQNSGTTATK